MLCPNEKSDMRQVKVESHYGQTVILDQCPDCGGIWFDTLEMYMAKQGQADQIDLLNAPALTAPSSMQNSERFCPRDRAKLVKFIDPYFSKDIIIERCPICGGLWLNRGEFTKYQKFRQSKLAKKEQPVLIEELPGTEDRTETLGNLAKFLSTPLDNAWRPLEPGKLSEKENAALNLILNVVGILLKFFIRI